jgi:hypothetical protein
MRGRVHQRSFAAGLAACASVAPARPAVGRELIACSDDRTGCALADGVVSASFAVSSWDALILYAFLATAVWVVVRHFRHTRTDDGHDGSVAHDQDAWDTAPGPEGPEPGDEHEHGDEHDHEHDGDGPDLLFRRNATELDGRDLRERLRAAEAGDTTPATLAWLATNAELEVRQAVARHPATPLEARWALVGDPDPRVRLEVARAWTTPSVMLGSMVADRHPEVSACAREQLSARRADDDA